MKVTIAATVEPPGVQNKRRENAVEVLQSSIETLRRRIVDNQKEIAKLEKRIAERQEDCRHNLVCLKDEEYIVFNMAGSPKLLVHKDKMVNLHCTECLRDYNTRIYTGYTTSCPQCFQKMVEDKAAHKPVLDMGDHTACSLGSFQCVRCDLSILVYIDTSD